MPRAMWSGSITFGLVNVPVRLFPAAQQKDVHFHMLTPDGKCRLRRKLYCPDTGKEYDFKDTKRGYEVAPDEYVVIDDEELQSLKPKAARAIEISDFVDLNDIDPVYFQKPYYLAPDERGGRGYHLLWRAMTDAHMVGIARFIMRAHEYLAAIRPLDGGLCLETMNFADEVLDIRDLPGIGSEPKIPAKELAMARQLIDALAPLEYLILGMFMAQRGRQLDNERVSVAAQAD